MNTAEIVVVLIVFIMAGVCAFIGIRHFTEKGFLFNNAYIWASKTEREKMDKKPYYRQSGIVLCLISAVFIVIGMSVLLHNYKIQLLEIPLMAGALIYAIVSSVRIEKQNKK